jgi:hypothetical protein
LMYFSMVGMTGASYATAARAVAGG